MGHLALASLLRVAPSYIRAASVIGPLSPPPRKLLPVHLQNVL